MLSLCHCHASRMSLVPLPKTNNEETDENNKPRSLQDLLSFSTRLHDFRQSGETIPSLDVNDERMRFLRNVLAELHVDPVQIMKNYVSLLDRIQHESAPEEEVHNAILELIDLVACMDMAKLFYQVGGLKSTIPLLDGKFSTIRGDAAKLIFECCQNNIHCQQLSTGDKVFLPLMKLAKDHSNIEVTCSAMSAIMAIVQNNGPGLEHFRRHNGFTMIINAINSSNKKVVSKGLYFMDIILGTFQFVKEDLLRLNVVGTLIKLLKEPDDNETMSMVHEYALRNLVQLSEHPDAVVACNQPQYGLTEFLKRTIQERQTDEAYMEIVEFAEILLKRVSIPEE